MERLMGFCYVIFVGIFLISKWDVESFELYNGNGTEVSMVESMSYLESVYGIANAAPPANALMVPLTLVQGADANGAVCLDGTLPGYHLHRGFGSRANSWLVQLEGGGWCNNVRTCVFRKKTRRGSSKYFEKQITFTGILSNKSEENPDFFNWNRVKIRYCDGASFSGDGENKAAGLLFRGQRIWQAAMQELMSKGMRNANQALLSGCSAGGLASILHCDEFRDLFPASTKVKCLSDAGLFMDAADVSGGQTIRNFFSGVVSLQRAASMARALQRLVFTFVSVIYLLVTECSGCWKKPAKHLHQTPRSNFMFLPQNLIANIKAPLFILNAAYDSWQVVESLASPKADPQGNWKSCRKNIEQCSASQIQFLQGFRDQILNAIKGFTTSKQSGLFINSCFLHCQSETQAKWFAGHSPAIDGKAIATSVGDWYFDRASVKAIDCAYPCDKSC